MSWENYVGRGKNKQAGETGAAGESAGRLCSEENNDDEISVYRMRDEE